MPGVQGGVDPPPGVVPNFQNPTDIVHTSNIVLQGVGIGLVTPFVAVRVLVKAYHAPPFLFEDCRSSCAIWILGTVQWTYLSSWIGICIVAWVSRLDARIACRDSNLPY
jgi:hypothetical protein